MHRKYAVLIACAVLVLGGCLRNYRPNSGEAAAVTYQNACVSCHEKDTKGKFFTFSGDHANLVYINKVIQEGTMVMPKFPKIQGTQLTQLSEYVLDNSATR